MPNVFNTLPGFEVPVGTISKSLGGMWDDAARNSRPAPANDDVKATQVNLVIHLGFGTTPDDAHTQFQTAVRFSRRYPCRVVVLCPLPINDTSTDHIRAKIYGECHLGKTKGDTRCCEFVMLSYPMSARRFLENQVSICLSTDLPLYYWVHRFSSAARLADYQYLLVRSKRILLDSAVIPAGFASYPWPKPDAMRDLALARILPLRQTIGQFLSSCPPELLVKDLLAVRCAHDVQHSAEAHALLQWTKERLSECGMGDRVAFTCTQQSASSAALSLDFEYASAERTFQWQYNLAGNPNSVHADTVSAALDTLSSNQFPSEPCFARAGTAHIKANLCNGPITLQTPLSLLAPEASLAEALFF